MPALNCLISQRGSLEKLIVGGMCPAAECMHYKNKLSIKAPKGGTHKLKNLTKLLYCNVALLLLFGCSEDSKEEMTNEVSDNEPKIEVDAGGSEEEMANEASDGASEIEVHAGASEEGTNIDDSNSNGNSSKEKMNTEQKDSSNAKEKEPSELSKYSSGQIEYARVWLQLGPNQEIDNLYVKQIPKGTPLNPDDDTSMKYPEDVVQLSGSRLVDGAVTYSSNGDGTINVYDVPLRWYGGSPPPEDIDKEKVQEDMKNIINNTKKVYIDPNHEEKVVAVIKKIKTN